MTTIRDIKKQASDVQAKADAVRYSEDVLLSMVIDHLSSKRGSAREAARKMGFSAQYICDVRHGRRKVSPEFVDRLERL